MTPPYRADQVGSLRRPVALADRPAGMTITMHTCRGNFKSAWVAEVETAREVWGG